MEQFIELLSKPVAELTDDEKKVIVEKIKELQTMYNVEPTQPDTAAEDTAAKEAQDLEALKELVELETAI